MVIDRRSWNARVGLALAGSLLGAGPTVAQWTTYQADNQHTGRAGVIVNPLSISKVWSAPQGYGIPLVVGNTVYSMRNQQGIGGDTTSVRSFDLTTGAVNWTYSQQFVFPSEPTFQGGDVVFAAQAAATGVSSLYVLNAATGALRYTVPLPASALTVGMPVVQADGGGVRRAYVVHNGSVSAVQLGATSGSISWTGAGNFSSGPNPAVLGNSVLVAGPGQYYAYDLQTGARNQFQSGGVSGGGSATIVADAASNRFYVLEAYSGSVLNALTAYSYVNNSTITQLWQRSDTAIGNGGNVAVGPDGKLYVANNTTLSELDPTTGATLRSLPGRQFPNGVAPILSNGDLWIYETTPGGAAGVSAFDLTSFTRVNFFTGGRGSLNSGYDGPGALAGGAFVLDYGNIFGQPGFDVYLTPIPEPTSLALCGAAAVGAVWVRRRRRRDRRATESAGGTRSE
jgi:hypothetical protein